ncbi:MAG: hypothetical protein ACXWQO_16915, partial [Bdellovibrionota bacterium]
MNKRMVNKFFLGGALALLLSPSNASALTLDWSGYFRADHNFVHDYQMDKASPGYSNSGDTGEYIPGQGKKTTTFSSVFMKLKPRVLVNDNVIVRSEWNVGDPVYGFFGRNIPREDRNNPFSTQKDGMDLSVARLWLDVHTDFGTVQVGRAPFHWGLGVIFNSGDRPFDRYQSTSDTIRLVSKFGYLSLMPLYAKNAMGRSLAGARNPFTDAILQGSDDVTDYGLGLKYENPEEDLEGGALYYKRNANDAQNNYYYPAGSTTYTGGSNGMNLKLINLYAKKSWKRVELGAELPIYSGEIGDMNGVGTRNTYKATAVAIEAALKYDTWKHSLKLGSVPGQSPTTSGAANRGSAFGAMQFHRAYKLGQILFNYNLGNFGAVNPDPIPTNAGTPVVGQVTPTSVSPYDASVTNAKYVMFSSEKRWEQWGMNFGVVWAKANQSAKTGKDAFNYRTRQWFTSVADQGTNLGIEAGFGTRYNWDDNISFGAEIGMLFPGDYFKYINNASKQGPGN